MASQLAPQPAGAGVPCDVGALWLDTLQRICDRAAHEVKGVLNGTSVNLEVVRSRAEKPEVLASAVSRYANAAADQLGAVIAMTEALLSLARPAREPLEIDAEVKRLDVLLGPAVRGDGRHLSLDATIDGLGPTTASGAAARLAIAAAVLAGIDASADVVCRARGGAAEATLVIECRDGSTVAMNEAMVGAAADAGIRVTAEPSAISINFPR